MVYFFISTFVSICLFKNSLTTILVGFQGSRYKYVCSICHLWDSWLASYSSVLMYIFQSSCEDCMRWYVQKYQEMGLACYNRHSNISYPFLLKNNHNHLSHLILSFWLPPSILILLIKILKVRGIHMSYPKTCKPLLS